MIDLENNGCQFLFIVSMYVDDIVFSKRNELENESLDDIVAMVRCVKKWECGTNSNSKASSSNPR